ncbi:hypothetical protein MKX03_006767 [Papaver bracteatum]|nr:hypothetical protein MKX03_006767 [Papaver bracteatum]
MNNLRGFVSTAGLPSFAGNFNRGSLIHNGKGRDSPECVLGKAARPWKFQVKDKDLESDDSMMNLYGYINCDVDGDAFLAVWHFEV